MEAKTRAISIGNGGSTAHVEPGAGRAVRMPHLRLLTRKVSGERTGGAYVLFEAAVDPGGGEGPHVQHREDECFYVLEGRFRFVVEGEEIETGPGSLVYVPKGALHAYENAGETRGRMLAIQTPGGAYEGFVAEIGEPVGDGLAPPAAEPPKDAGRIAAAGALYGVEMVPSPPRSTPGHTR